MGEIKDMSIDDLQSLQTQIKEEIERRSIKSELVLYTHSCKNAAKHHLSKYKHWAKLVQSVDTTKTNGYAFMGDFLTVTTEHKIPSGSIVVEMCEPNVYAYRVTADGKTLIAECDRRSMSSLIEIVAKEIA